MPASVRAWTTPTSAATRSRAGALTRRVSSSTSAAAPVARSTSRAAAARRSRSRTTTTSRSSPSLDFSSSGRPDAMTRPASSTDTVSASWSASSRYCVVSSTAVPARTSSRTVSHTSLRPRGSSPVVGSSRNSTAGRGTMPAARSSRRRMPPEYVLTGRSAASARPKPVSNSFARARAAAGRRWNSRANSTRFCRPVSRSSSAVCWPTRPIRRRTDAASLRTSEPATFARPASARSNVARTRTAVVLPAPFGPSSPWTVPAGTATSNPSSAAVVPYAFRSPSATTTGALPVIRPPLCTSYEVTSEHSIVRCTELCRISARRRARRARPIPGAGRTRTRAAGRTRRRRPCPPPCRPGWRAGSRSRP
jgi:hypothetical protein